MSINETILASMQSATQKLPAKWATASADVVKAIRQASAYTGVSFDYLMDKAKTESSFKTDIKAKTSSATGLFQFIDSTWLQTIKEHGAKYGLGDLVSKMDTDKSVRKQVLELRKDPAVAAVMTAEATKEHQYYLETSVGGTIGQNELYLAHFLGLGGATKFLRAKNQNENAAAADIFPQAAQANKNVFYEASGKKRSLKDVYAFFAKKMDAQDTNPVVASASNMVPNPISWPLASSHIAKPKAPTAPSAVPTAMTPIDHDFMARIGGARVHHGEAQASKTQNWTQAFTGMQDILSVERHMMDMALGSFSSTQKRDAENGQGLNKNGGLQESKLLAPFTAMVLAKLSVVGEATQDPKSQA
jgi:hypothetical protein